MHYIYLITNLINNKIYVGQTNNPSLRWSQHRSNAKYNRGTQVITRAITKYGDTNFIFEVIASCKKQEDADKSEEEIIMQYDSRNPNIGYNIDAGGNTTPRTTEVLKKISDGLNKFYKTHESHMKGKKLSDEWKENISKASIGKPGTNTGKIFSDEHRSKMSKSQVGRENINRRRFSQDIEKEICNLYINDKKSAYALGKQFGAFSTTIIDIIKRNGIEIRKSNYTGHSNGCNIFSKEQEIEICNIYNECKISITKLSEQFKCGKTTIRDILIRHNIKL